MEATDRTCRYRATFLILWRERYRAPELRLPVPEMSPGARVFLYGKKKAAVAALIGAMASALWIWAIASGQDYVTFEGEAAKGAFTVFLALSALMLLVGLFRLLFRVVLITVDSDGLRVRGKLSLMKRVPWAKLRWIEHPFKSDSTFRIRSLVGMFAVYGLSNEDRVELFKLIEERGVPIRPDDHR